MKKKKNIIFALLLLVLAVGVAFGTYFYLANPNRLTSVEKRYLADNSSVVQNINVLNNVNIFGDTGEGVFYDFLEDFSNKYSLKINPVTFNLGENINGVTFTSGNGIADTEFILYQSHYVLLGKKNEYIASPLHLRKQQIGILSANLSYVQQYFGNDYITFQSYSSNEELLNAFEEQSNIQYIMVPMDLYLNEILEKDYYVVSHYESIPYYYKVNITANSNLGNIMKKYFATWKKDKLQKSYNDHLFKLFVKTLNVSLTDIDTMRGVTYQYGFVDNRPYEILSGGNYGGIVAQYLKEFTDFSDTEIKFTKYKTYEKFSNALQQNKINLYFGYYDSNNSYKSISSNIGISYSVLAKKDDALVVQSLSSLNNKTIYTLDNTTLADYLKSQVKANIKTFKDLKALKKAIKDDDIVVVIDTQTYYGYSYIFGDYSERYKEVFDVDYVFKANTNDVFYKMFTRFINLKNPNEAIYKGVYNYESTLRAGTITGTIARYFMYILIVVVLAFLYVYRVTKRVKISKKIKKEDKLKYIDQLTSLKNRNYLSENLENWSQNTIYPQAVVVIDLNSLQAINDTAGYDAGDEQIKSTANILVKTQLDNSDIIRTDGNEFVIYLVGYQTKQVTSYIHKLNKEFKKLPYEYGAAIGYSMISDNLKSVEDAINEAVEDVKKQKENKKEEK